MSDPANLVNHANELVEFGRTLQETGRKLEEVAEALRNESAAWAKEKARADEVQARLTAQIAQATRGVSINVNLGAGVGHSPSRPRTSVNARVDHPGSNATQGGNRVVEVLDD
jgi:hypothetical protein